jgi:hypothetical protein
VGAGKQCQPFLARLAPDAPMRTVVKHYRARFAVGVVG